MTLPSRRPCSTPDDAAGLGRRDRVPVIAKPVRADEDTVRDVIHRFNEIGRPARTLGGREAVPACSALTTGTSSFRRPPSVRPSSASPSPAGPIRKLAAYLRKAHGRVIWIGREALRSLLAGRHRLQSPQRRGPSGRSAAVFMLGLTRSAVQRLDAP
jgi:hypothetical protein